MYIILCNFEFHFIFTVLIVAFNIILILINFCRFSFDFHCNFSLILVCDTLFYFKLLFLFELSICVLK